MNHQLWQAHLENTALKTANRLLKRRISRLTRAKVGRCVYCGNPTHSMIGACPAHHDLPAIDPDYAGQRTT